MPLSFEQLSFFFKEFVQNLKFQISSSTQESRIDIECPLREDREQYYGYRITQDFILAFENEIKKFIDPAGFYDPTCASLTRNWLLKELRLHQLDYKCCVDPVLEPEDSTDEDSEEVGGITDEKEDDKKTDEDEGGPIDYEDTKEDDTKTDEHELSHYGDEEGDTSHYEDEKYDDEEGGTIHYENEKDDDTKTDEEESTHYEDEKDDDSKTDEHEGITNDHHEDTKEDEDEGYTSHDHEDDTSGFGDVDDEFEVEYDAEEVVVVVSVCSDDPISFKARPTQAQVDIMTMLLDQPPQWWVSYRDI